MTISHTDLAGISEKMARRIIAIARSIAPCLDSLEGEAKTDAIAILDGIALEGVARGSRLIKTQRINQASVEYVVDGSWFSADDRGALRALCVAAPSGALPVGSFPKTSRELSRMWPEDC